MRVGQQITAAAFVALRDAFAAEPAGGLQLLGTEYKGVDDAGLGELLDAAAFEGAVGGAMQLKQLPFAPYDSRRGGGQQVI